MLSHTRRVLYKVYGGKVYMDLKVWSTLEPHAEKFNLSNVQVDPNETGLVLPLELKDSMYTSQWMQDELAKHEPLEGRTLEELAALGKAVGLPTRISIGKKAFIAAARRHVDSVDNKRQSASSNLLKDIFKSWPRLYHQKEFERSYVSKRIQVLELGPFEVQLEGMARPAVCNVQFSPDMPVGDDGLPDIRIGADIARRSHYLFPEQVEGGLLASLSGTATVETSKVAPYGSTPHPTPARNIPGAGRLYSDDEVRPHWSVFDGRTVTFPRTPISVKRDLVAEQLDAKRQVSGRPSSGPSDAATPQPTSTSTAAPSAIHTKPKAKKWEGWKL